MPRIIRVLAPLSVEILLGSVMLFGQTPVPIAWAGNASSFGTAGLSHGFGFSHHGYRSFFNNFQFGYDGYVSPFSYAPYYPALSPPGYPYLPNHWWVSPYPIEDPRQEGYNPSAGYPKESAATLLLATRPAKSRVTLDGVFVGTADALGPIQFPMGEHTLRVEASGYEPSDTILKVEEPLLQQLEIRLAPAEHVSKPAPKS